MIVAIAGDIAGKRVRVVMAVAVNAEALGGSRPKRRKYSGWPATVPGTPSQHTWRFRQTTRSLAPKPHANRGR